jgi:hypothetical protein
MENSYRKVPWKDWSEWLSAYSSLRSDRSVAFSLFQLWEIRSSLPVRVNSTRMILSATKDLTNSLDISQLGNLTSESSRLAVGMCIVRVINHLTDLGHAGKNAASVITLARNIHLPEYIIDIRHACTHGELPTMDLMAKAIQDLYDYLLQQYWDSQYAQIHIKRQAIVKKVDKYEKKAKVIEDVEALMKYCENLFPKDIAEFRAELAVSSVKVREKLSDDAWGVLFLKLSSGIPKFGESVIQGCLKAVEQDSEKLLEMKKLIEEIVVMSQHLKLTVTSSIKSLIILSNTNKDAFDLLSFLLSHSCFSASMSISISELSNFSFFSPSLPSPSEIPEVPPLPRWRQVARWEGRPIGLDSS